MPVRELVIKAGAVLRGLGVSAVNFEFTIDLTRDTDYAELIGPAMVVG
jgi:hypothetical protein